MSSPSVEAVTTNVKCLSPQFLVDDSSVAIDYYREQLGFEVDFVHESFYASVSCVFRTILNTDSGHRDHSSVAKFGAFRFS